MRRRDGALIERNQVRLAQEHRAQLVARWHHKVPGTAINRTVDDVREGWDGRMNRSDRFPMRKYLDNGGTRFLLLSGDEGVGKSTLAVTVAAHLIATKGLSAEYRTGPQLLSAFSFHDRGEDPVADAARPGLLLIDDLGASVEAITPTQQRSLWDLIDRRWGNPQCRTIITTNMSIGDEGGKGLAGWVGKTAWARIADDLTEVLMTGTSFRGR